ncbi:hypothetical protein N1851_025824 [Merluccius polli]|uniref:Chemokine interleukin-8-like domain-containing protein n=1 Tax=Merluccius polli TaxID=89951 RepID=A0AA47MCX8_MERPO|nr:hypothetical protein N1851_025824 [Merluccius polli]
MCPSKRESIDICSSMKCHHQLVCQLAVLSFCCALITVRESDSSFVPGRCVCPETNSRVRGMLKNFTVVAKNPKCDKVTLIVVLNNSKQVCLDPNKRQGRQLVQCWNRLEELTELSSKLFIRFPLDNQQLHRRIKANFMACRYAGVIGAVDGTHIQIIAPSKDEDVFVNRKKVHTSTRRLLLMQLLTFLMWLQSGQGLPVIRIF